MVAGFASQILNRVLIRCARRDAMASEFADASSGFNDFQQLHNSFSPKNKIMKCEGL
jgi:hypothetical protein